MNCVACAHSDLAHAGAEDGESLMRLGACRIPGCPCGKFREAIHRIDEELL